MSSIVLVVIDSCDLAVLSSGDLFLDNSNPKFEFLKEIPTGTPVHFVFTKSDLLELQTPNPKLCPEANQSMNYSFISSKSKPDIKRIESVIEENMPKIVGEWVDSRHIQELRKIREGLLMFNERTTTIDIRSEGIRQAVRSIGRLAGYVQDEDVLNVVFSKFCVGK